MSFITAGEVQAEAIRSGLLSTETAIDSDIQLLIDLIESQIILWLGWDPNPEEYRETCLTGPTGHCLTSHYPILELISIELKGANGGAPLPDYAWNGSLRTISARIPGVFVKLVYRAGLDPIPKIFRTLAKSLALSAIKSGSLITGDLDFLSETPQVIRSLSLPGGLSTTYQDTRSDSSSENSSGDRFIDKFLAPISSHRRRIET